MRFFDQNCMIEKLHENIDFVIRFPEWKLLLDAYNSSKSLEDLKVVADLMSPFYSKKNYNQSPFYNAVQAGNVKFIKLFIDFKFIHLGERDHNGNTSMHHACASGLMDVVELFVEEFGIYGTKPIVTKYSKGIRITPFFSGISSLDFT